MKKQRLISLIACFSVKIKNARLLRHENASYVMSEVKKNQRKTLCWRNRDAVAPKYKGFTAGKITSLLCID